MVASGVTIKGEKVVLGFVQTATENERVCSQFLRSLVDRGLNVEPGVLCVIDGAKGLRKAVGRVFGSKAAVRRRLARVIKWPNQNSNGIEFAVSRLSLGMKWM